MSEQKRTVYPQLLLDSQLCFPLYACARKVIGAYTPLLKPLGLTYTQYIVMLELWEKEKEKVGELCRRLYLDCGTVTPMLKKMEESGWLTRCRCKVDERVVYVALTEKGRALRIFRNRWGSAFPCGRRKPLSCTGCCTNCWTALMNKS